MAAAFTELGGPRYAKSRLDYRQISDRGTAQTAPGLAGHRRSDVTEPSTEPADESTPEQRIIGGTGVHNTNWKGGRSVTPAGYVLIKFREHPDADTRGYVYEHRLIAERMLGRRLLSGEIVHHRNGDKGDNRPENLEVTTRPEHAVLHRKRANLRLPGEPNPIVLCACGCRTAFLRFDASRRPRSFVSGHNLRVAS